MKWAKIDIARLSDYEVVCGDFETTGLNWRTDKPFGIALAAMGKDAATGYSGYFDLRDQPQMWNALCNELPKVKRFVNHHAKFDVHFARTAGIVLPFGAIECTMVRAALINEHEQAYNLNHLAMKYIGRGKEEGIYAKLADLFGGKPTHDAQINNLYRAPVSLVAAYATRDAELALQLWLWQEAEIQKQELGKIWAMEKELTSVLVEIERPGIPIDESHARGRLEWILPERQRTVSELIKKYGQKYGIDEKVFNSPKQKRQLFEVDERDGVYWAGGIKLDTTDTGAPTIDAGVLRSLAKNGDIRAKLIQRAQKLDKAKQFLENHVLGHLENGRVYPHYNQTRSEFGTGTGTGRLSIEAPALQQIPKRDKEMAEIVRPCFVPERGQDWVCCDWKQFEFRWFAHYVDDPDINEMYNKNPDIDFHQITADLTGLPRNPRFAGDANAKQINLGLVFGMGMGKLAAEIGLPFTIESMVVGGEMKEVYKAGPEAQAVFEKYHSSIPGVQKLLKQASSIAKSRGYVRTAMDRHLRFPGGKFTHKAGGLVFQGTSADCCKAKLIELYKNGHRQGEFRLMLSVHDEFDMSIPKGDARTRSKVQKILEVFDGVSTPIKCAIPIKCDVNTGPNWHEASK